MGVQAGSKCCGISMRDIYHLKMRELKNQKVSWNSTTELAVDDRQKWRSLVDALCTILVTKRTKYHLKIRYFTEAASSAG